MDKFTKITLLGAAVACFLIAFSLFVYALCVEKYWVIGEAAFGAIFGLVLLCNYKELNK